MEKVIYFNNDDGCIDRCSGQVYLDFLDYAFEKADFFMLVYVNYYGDGYTKCMKQFREALKPYLVKRRTNPSWPGTLETICPNTTYYVAFYRTDPKAKRVLQQVESLSDWSCPSYPQDLAFFKGNTCWMNSTGHEKMAAIIHATDEDIVFLESHGLAVCEDAEPYDDYYDAYDEKLK